MGRSAIPWILALLVTVIAAAYQERTGPTFPVRSEVTLGGQQIPIKLLRSWADGDQPIELTIADRSVTGRVRWRRYPSSDQWQVQPLQRSGDVLKGSLPHQPPAGKLEYQVELTRQRAQSLSRAGESQGLVDRSDERVIVPDRAAVTRFKGNVSPTVLVPHVFAMFVGMLFSTRAGLEAISGGPGRRWMTTVAVGLLLVGGFVLGPLVQKAAFGAYWTGVPWGYDLTDNKTLIAVAAWLLASWRVYTRPGARWSPVFAALVTLVVFAIPHSVWGSEIKWQ